MANCITFLDSGVGGLPYLKRTREILPEFRYAYIADPGNFPYGEKKPEKLVSILIRNVDNIISSLDPALIVVACNTASVVALEALRRNFDLPFVGVVPAVKPAAELSRNRRIGILATRETVGNPYTQGLIDSFAADSDIFRFAGVDIVNFVEKNLLSSSLNEQKAVLEEAAAYFCHNRVDTVVLGCTHFIHLKDALQKMLGEEILVIDSVEGVARQVVKISSSLVTPHMADKLSNGMYIASGDVNLPSLKAFARRFSLPYRGIITEGVRSSTT